MNRAHCPTLLACSLLSTGEVSAVWMLPPLKRRTATTPGPKPVTALKVLAALADGHDTTKAIADATGLTRTVVGQSLHSLKRNGFVRQFGSGRKATWSRT